VNAQIFRAFAALRYKWNEKLKFGTGLEFFHRDYEDQLDSRELINENFVDYGITPKTDLGLGVTLGRLDVDASTGDQTYEQFLLRLTTRTTAKFKLLARAGVELRQYSPSGSESTPVFGLGAEYKPWDGTELGLELYRDVNPSISTPGENIIATGIRLRARQRVFRRWRLGLTAGYENSDFTVADAVSAETFDTRADANRDDDYFFIRPAIAYEFKKGIRGEIFYLYRKNTSSLQGSAFTNNQVGARVSLEY